MDTTLFTLFHLADSALPVGGYAYSSGLEYAVKSGMISNVPELEVYLESFAAQIINFELPYVKSVFETEDTAEIQIISSHYNASLLNPLLKKAGLTLGKNWLRLMQNLDKSLVSPSAIELDFPLVYGHLCKQLHMSLNNCFQLYVYMAVRDQISALIRLGTIGPSKAHQIQNQLLKKINSSLKQEGIPAYTEAFKSAYVLEMIQLSHNTLYTKLFQN